MAEHHHHHHHHHHNDGTAQPTSSLKQTLRRKTPYASLTPGAGARAYARAAMRWKFQQTEDTAFWVDTSNSFVADSEGAQKTFRVLTVSNWNDLRKKKPQPNDGGSSPPPAAVGGTTEVPADSLENDLEYVVDVTIGTPGNTLQLDFDTGSSDLWVWSSEFTPRGGVGTHNIYNPAQSSTAQEAKGLKWSITYGDGSSASGNVYTDAVKIGSLVIPNQAVELAQKLSSDFVSSGSDGLLGLAWPGINTVTPTPQKTPVENLIEQSLIPQGLFTVKLDRGDNQGFYSFGLIDESVTSDPIVYTPVDNSQGFWQFASETAIVNGKTIKRSGNSAIADTGTTLALVDDATVKAIYAAIPGAKMDKSQGGYVFPTSSKPPTVSFAVGPNKQIQINPDDFAFGPASGGYYFGGVQSRGSLDFDILGDVWLKSVYVVFDQAGQRIGVAQRSD